MKVILLADVPKVGNRYDVKDLAPGYAQSVLIARGLAEMATPVALGKLDERKANMNKKKEEESKAFSELVNTLDKKVVLLKVKANDKGHLFSAVSKKDIVEAIKNSSGVVIDEQHISFPKPIKEIGTHSVQIKKGERTGECSIVIQKE
jgi:large subunit ribosomal protein L9